MQILGCFNIKNCSRLFFVMTMRDR